MARARIQDEPIPGAFASADRHAGVEVFAVEQRSDAWFQLRLGIPTASNFAKIMAQSEERVGRTDYMEKLAGEILTGEPMETFSNAHMQRGIDMEPEARAHHEFTREVELTPVGFVRRTLPGGRLVGCSPDSFIGTDRVLEVKTMAPHLMIRLARNGRFPTEHRAQCQGTLWVTGRSVCDLKIFYRGMPISPTFSIERDEAYIRTIAEAVEVFDYELRKLVEQIRNMGGKR